MRHITANAWCGFVAVARAEPVRADHHFQRRHPRRPRTTRDEQITTWPVCWTASPTGAVHSFDVSTGVDGPGTRFVAFLAGCPLRCLHCHSPDTWNRWHVGTELDSAIGTLPGRKLTIGAGPP